MLLTQGTRLGPYEIVAPLGRGGMGEVYRARDTRLAREVAIKVLSPAVAHEAERLARFEREARLLASLNHPNIAAIYGLEVAGGVPHLVLELVEGETLASRLARGPLELREALAVCGHIAAAIEAAHERGIVHRSGVALCTATNDQRSPWIATDGAGGAIVTWPDFRSGTDYDIYAQNVRADGTLGGNLVSVPTGPAAASFALHSLQPNPTVGDFTILFSPPDGAPATLELYDVGGRRLESLSVGNFGPGTHLASLTSRSAYSRCLPRVSHAGEPPRLRHDCHHPMTRSRNDAMEA